MKWLAPPEIGKIERLFDMEIETDDFTTIAGLVINESGRVPPPGELLDFSRARTGSIGSDEAPHRKIAGEARGVRVCERGFSKRIIVILGM
jgi:Mg2+/Co2+ transporter CorC